MKQSTILYALIVIGFFSTISCKKLVEIDMPRNQITNNSVFADSANANAAVVGIYINMMQSFGLGFSSGAITAYTGLSSDELYLTANNQNAEFYAASILPTNSTVSSLWGAAYTYLYATNACIEGLENSTTLTDSQQGILLGEALVLRAFLYFNLVNLYGEVPLVLTTDYQTNRLKSRTPVKDVYNQIITDLEKAKLLIPKSPTPNIRANFYAATALLARIYLYNEEYEKALKEADIVINSGIYELEPNLKDIFLVGSKEIIWGFAPVYPGRETWEGYYFIPSSETSVPTYVFNDTFFDDFETGDLRKNEWVRININNGKEYPIPYKYKMNALVGSAKEKYSVLRLAEQYLIRAEAYTHLNEISKAKGDIDKIRNRAGINNVSDNDETSVLDLIAKERKAELMSEWGHRWFDLKRTNQVGEVLLPLKPNWKQSSKLFPIPQLEINKNPNLAQNDGY